VNLKDLQKKWDEFGESDPFWSILSSSEKKGGKWQVEGFFGTGVKEIGEVINYVESLGINVPRKMALDFGCGVGRLTQALADYFDEVVGIDISPSMIELANKYNRYGNKCIYYLNTANDLKLFPDNRFNLIYSNITLQHMEPRYSKNYIKEFLRILAPQGIIIFQLPSESTQTLRKLIRHIIPTLLLNFYNKVRYGGTMEMYGIYKDEVLRLLRDNGGKILEMKKDQYAVKGWISFRYFVTKE